MSGRSQVNDRKSSKAQRKSNLWINPLIAHVRPAMDQCVGHAAYIVPEPFCGRCAL